MTATIESYLQPRRLYRYRSLANVDREIDAITNGYLYCSPYRNLNDPMEGSFASSGLLKKSLNYRAVRAAIKDNKAQLGICSFSEVRDHELMWAHYAQQFTGICAAYSLSRLMKQLAHGIGFVRMHYDETVPMVHRTKKDPTVLAKMVLSCKNYRWLYEREWRMFAPIGKAEYGDTACVLCVYLGYRVSSKNRKLIRDALKELAIPVRSMTIDEYFIDFEDSNSD